MVRKRKIGILVALEQNPEFVTALVREPLDADQAKDRMFEYAVNATPMAEADRVTALAAWNNPVIRQLISDFNYTGEWPRAFRQLGYTLLQSAPDGKTRNKNTNGTKWQLTPRAQGRQEADNFPANAYAAWASAKKCNLSGLPLDGHFHLDHRQGRHFFGNVNLTPASSDDECRSVTQPLHERANMKKREVCNKCQKSKVRPAGPYTETIPFWFEGDEKFSDDIGCRGCFWAYPEQWQASLNSKVIPIKSS